jgi:death-on-curing protein
MLENPVIDGNKRAALASALVFLEINNISIFDPKKELLGAILSMASGKLSKKEFSDILRNLDTAD